ncbi:MAG: DUF1330 domain-containing protein [Kordiimonadaceae bacterium]|nr:DUF1330 domain-containing protein [Kordiimonadaceae bacterium]
MPYIDPERDQFNAFKELPCDQPVNMLNLVKLRKNVVYADGTETTGAEAYSTYSLKSGPFFQRAGGRIIWRGEPQVMLIGPQEEAWDLAFIARYPTASAFLEMITDPDYQVVMKHRQAAVETSRLLRCAELECDADFG